jgi:serine/threonine protein kinase/Tfp pilus assembly protein PilF
MSEITARLAEGLGNRYKLERRLGEGGMATVYLAEDLKHQRQVAVKVLKPELAAVLGRERFLREITTTANLRHPNILPLYDSGDADGFLFYVMPYAEGDTLRDRLKREKQLSLADARQITCDVADALSYAHSRGVIHRDIKPENVLLESGHAVVADFGIAWVLDAAEERLTQTGISVGTPAYMSPEQAGGEGNLDGRSDLYALGCVLYEMLAGQPPFTGATAESVVYQHLVAEPRAITQVRPGIPDPVAKALAQLLAKTPADRLATGAALIEALQESETAAPVSVSAPERSIAVLPFTNMSPDPENEYFADGVGEEIINALTKLPGLKVAARTSAFSFKGKDEDLRSIGEKLGVANVLKGSVRKAGNRLRVTAQLIGVADGYHAWSERYDRELHDVFAIQDEIAAAIAERLKLTFQARPGALVQPGTANVDAYQLYLKGRELLYRRGKNIDKARECFEQALAVDPNYALAQAGLGDALTYMAMWGVRPAGETAGPAKRAIRRSLELAPELAEAHYALACSAYYHDADPRTSTREFARAVELNPSYIQGRCGRALYDLAYYRGDFETALAEADGAVADDPLSAYAVTIRAQILSCAGRHAEAVAEARRATELDPDSIVAWWQLQCITGWAGGHDESVKAGQTALSLSERFSWGVATLAAEHGRASEGAAAQALYDELAQRAASGHVQPTMIAIAAVGCGRYDEALALLLKAAAEPDGVLPSFVKFWPDLEPARRQPQYREVLRRMGPDWEGPAVTE